MSTIAFNEQNPALKHALQYALETSLRWRGGRDKDGRPIEKYAFLSKKERKKLKAVYILHLKDGRRLTLRWLG